jgi:short-chain Z-isoprenyl diphosphate synthase
VSLLARTYPVARRALNLLDSITKPLYWLYEQQLLREISVAGRLPRHIGIIMDGNRRFARTIGLDVRQGHDYGAGKAREVLDWCLELGISHVTLWGFSTDNRSRKPEEVSHLHSLFAKQARDLLNDQRLHANRVRVRVIGDIADFPEGTKEALHAIEKATESYEGMQLNIALGYGGREEIVCAVKNLLYEQAAKTHNTHELAKAITAEAIERYLYTAGTPDPDFVIRTSGEVRLSGFLLWQTAYSEFYFCDAFWPSFRKLDFLRALRSFQDRERRFGK